MLLRHPAFEEKKGPGLEAKPCAVEPTSEDPGWSCTWLLEGKMSFCKHYLTELNA